LSTPRTYIHESATLCTVCRASAGPCRAASVPGGLPSNEPCRAASPQRRHPGRACQLAGWSRGRGRGRGWGWGRGRGWGRWAPPEPWTSSPPTARSAPSCRAGSPGTACPLALPPRRRRRCRCRRRCRSPSRSIGRGFAQVTKVSSGLWGLGFLGPTGVGPKHPALEHKSAQWGASLTVCLLKLWKALWGPGARNKNQINGTRGVKATVHQSRRESAIGR
jgi:hypothetical protein